MTREREPSSRPFLGFRSQACPAPRRLCPSSKVDHVTITPRRPFFDQRTFPCLSLRHYCVPLKPSVDRVNSGPRGVRFQAVVLHSGSKWTWEQEWLRSGSILVETRSPLPDAVVPLRAGAENTVGSTWVLESPGHIANKFSSFVRVIYTTEASMEENSSASLPNNVQESSDPAIEEGGDEKEEEEDKGNSDGEEKTDGSGDDSGMFLEAKSAMNGSSKADAILPGTVRDAAPALAGSSQIIHCKTFIPRLVSSGGLCGSAEWENMRELLERLNAWVVASEGSLVTLQTHLVYASGNEVRPEETRWARPMRNAEQVGVLHAIVQGGRPPTAFPSAPPLPSRKCAIM
ncbi:uncharacterized protein LOC125032821 [Penaeus chinensis]|uniref:uncharacterized protein LOC125032821 n=1 Tax=Penaeus chinensis TaxID=139456 RepID=UPI001FB7836D|nr:uncharacterized protein LOC125032821 [Penaeus chinensis]